MRHLIAFLVLGGLMLQTIAAQTIGAQNVRVITWEVDGFEPVSTNNAPSEPDLKRLRQIAVNLKPFDAEVIVLHGLPDRQIARRLATFLKPITYHVGLYSTFKKGGTNNAIFGPSITVLTKKQPFTARSLEWRATGQIDLPGGFAFAGFNSGTNTFCVYVAHLPAPLTNSAAQYDSQTFRKRELAAQYLSHHANWLGGTLTNQAASFFVTGDFVVDPRTASTEGAVRILQQAGFKSSFPALPFKRSAASISETNPAPMLTALFARNADFATAPQLSPRKPFNEALVAFELTPGISTPVAAPVPAVAASRPVAAKVVELDQSLIWIWMGGIGALSLTILFSVWMIRRSSPASGTFGRRGGQSVVLDLGGLSGASNRSTFAHQAGESYSGSTTDAIHSELSLWQARAMKAEERAKRANAVMRTGMMPQLGRLMRERLVAWLTAQRSQLLTSHEVGTQQVLELEERLEKIQGQFQDRLKTREQRIAELEREILSKERLIRDLLRAQVKAANETPER
jgi:hypothetical protein